MSSFFEQELRKLFGDGKIIHEPHFVGRACLGSLGSDLRVRVEFTDPFVARNYDVLSVKVLNRTDGVVDQIRLRITETIGIKKIPNHPSFRDGLAPHIWTYNGKTEWYGYYPDDKDYQTMRQAVSQYLDVFRERAPEQERSGPKLVYICAPLRGNVEQNITFARQKAQEVFQEGDIPICPHLMFPPIADPNDPTQDQTAREMGLRLVDSCQQLNVYGPVWTDGMWAEIYRAEKNGLPIMTDQKEIGKTPPRHRSSKKER